MRKAFCILLTALLLAVICCAAFAEAPDNLLGTVVGQTYRNDYFGLQFMESDDWIFRDAIEAAESIHYASEPIASQEDLLRQLSSNGIVYVFQAEKADGSGDSVYVALMDIKALFGADLNVETLIDLLDAYSDTHSSSDIGIEEAREAREDVLLAGVERPSFSSETSFSGLTVYSRSVLVKQGSYLALVQAASVKKETVDEELARFLPTDSAAVLNEKTAAVLDDARLLINQGKGLEAMELLLTASKAAPNPALDTAIRRLENSQWKKTRQIVYRDDGSVLLDNTYAYDEGGRCVETKTLSPEGEVQSLQVYKFDQDGLPCETVTYDADGNEKSRSAITCDERGNMLRMEGSVIFTYSYNPYGDATLIVRSFDDGEEISRTVYAYDEYGLYTATTNLSDGKTSEVGYDNEYEFSDDGKAVHVISRLSGTDTVKIEYELSFLPLV